jgi:CheY-like chemotaxis protein
MNFPTFGKNKPQRMLRTLIIDDEPHVRETLQSLLQKFCPQVKVVGEAGSVATGAREIQEKRPDLVLLDIKMDDGTGFDLLNRFEHIGFKIIFVTAWEKIRHPGFRLQRGGLPAQARKPRKAGRSRQSRRTTGAKLVQCSVRHAQRKPRFARKPQPQNYPENLRQRLPGQGAGHHPLRFRLQLHPLHPCRRR